MSDTPHPLALPTRNVAVNFSRKKQAKSTRKNTKAES